MKLMAGVVKPAQSEWAGPIVLVLRKDGTLWFCMNYWRLNANTIIDIYPSPPMGDSVEILVEGENFIALDGLQRYLRCL